MNAQGRAPKADSVVIPTKVQLRDLDLTRGAIQSWLQQRISGDLEVEEVRLPSGAGVANETLLVRAQRTLGGQCREVGYVVRVGATEHLFMGMDVHVHYRIYDVLSREPDIPSPPVVGYEADPAIFGQPFFVMERIEGLVPADNPHFHQSGWVLDLSDQEQREVWRGFIEVMAKLHRIDPAKLSFLERPHLGRTGLEQELNHWLAYARWCGGDRIPIVQRASEWLVTHMPRDAPPGFSWGDSRPPNIIYQGARVAAVLDWDMASLAGAECDLGWWLYMDHAYTAGRGWRRPAGFGSRPEGLELWQDLMGRRAENLDWHLVFNALRIKLVMVRLPAMLVATGQISPEAARELRERDNMAWLGGLLAGPPPQRFGSRWEGWAD